MADTLIREIADDMNDAVKRALHRLTAEAHDLSRDARRAVGRTGRTASHIADDFAHETSAQGRRAARYAVREIRDHPVRTIALGAVLGILATLLVARR